VLDSPPLERALPELVGASGPVDATAPVDAEVDVDVDVDVDVSAAVVETVVPSDSAVVSPLEDPQAVRVRGGERPKAARISPRSALR